MTDTEKKLYETIEALNLEVIKLKKSKEYLTGSSIVKLKTLLKKGDFKKIVERFNYKRKYKYIEAHLTTDNNKNYNNNVSWNIDNTEKSIFETKKIAIYTCIVGNYDKLKEPFLAKDNIDYYLFTDNKDIKNKSWTVKEIPSDLMKFNNNTLINRYIKLHPHEFFYDYDYCVYIDGNVNIMSDITPMIKTANSLLGLGIYKHSSRNCIYLESEACKILKKGNTEKLEQQVKSYYHEGMPQNYGLLEATIIISNLNNNKSKYILNEWWDEFYKSESMRDQIALPYILWKNGYSINELGILGNNIYLNPKIRIDTH